MNYEVVKVNAEPVRGYLTAEKLSEKLSVLTSPSPSVKSDGTFNPFFRAA
ncbi:MAG: hypothetical protein KKE49_05870 [Proteobacteria bacterium]|nr:hypothetical protein [Pseudomonadota bacterium]